MVKDPGIATPESSIETLHRAVSAAPLELAVVVPTFNERANIPVLLDRLATTLIGISYEVIIVDDDSPDGTAEAGREIALYRRHVHVLRRIGRRGLSSACLEGMLATAAPHIAVMDGDLQHDESILPRMLSEAQRGGLDLVVASRNVSGGSMGEFSASRTRLSQLGRSLSHMVMRAEVSDPMSGFFLVNRKFLEETVYRTSGIGFKILLDLLASSPRAVRVAEVPYTFRLREAGESKLDVTVSLEYVFLLLDKLIGHLVPLRFVLYALVGALGVVLHLGTLWAARLAGMDSFRNAQTLATFASMTLNFLLNNLVTYRDSRLRGVQWLWGLLTFYAACALGAAVNLSVAERLLANGVPWLAAGFAGLVLSSVWNYGVTSVITWRRSRRRHRRS
jgi:dolichol-phosphate mannosyltransferase